MAADSRFVVAAAQDNQRGQLDLVQNWFEEVKRRVPVRWSLIELWLSKLLQQLPDLFSRQVGRV